MEMKNGQNQRHSKKIQYFNSIIYPLIVQGIVLTVVICYFYEQNSRHSNNLYDNYMMQLSEKKLVDDIISDVQMKIIYCQQQLDLLENKSNNTDNTISQLTQLINDNTDILREIKNVEIPELKSKDENILKNQSDLEANLNNLVGTQNKDRNSFLSEIQLLKLSMISLQTNLTKTFNHIDLLNLNVDQIGVKLNNLELYYSVIEKDENQVPDLLLTIENLKSKIDVEFDSVNASLNQITNNVNTINQKLIQSQIDVSQQEINFNNTTQVIQQQIQKLKISDQMFNQSLENNLSTLNNQQQSLEGLKDEAIIISNSINSLKQNVNDISSVLVEMKGSSDIIGIYETINHFEQYLTDGVNFVPILTKTPCSFTPSQRGIVQLMATGHTLCNGISSSRGQMIFKKNGIYEQNKTGTLEWLFGAQYIPYNQWAPVNLVQTFIVEAGISYTFTLEVLSEFPNEEIQIGGLSFTLVWIY